MQGGVIGGICLLAFLLSKGRAEETESLKESKALKDIEDVKENLGVKKISESEAPGDLKSEISLAVTESNSQDNEGRSGAILQNGARSFGDSSVSNDVAQSNDDGSVSAYSDSFGRSSQSKMTAVDGGAPASPFNPFNEELGIYKPPGSSLSEAKAQATSGNLYDQGLNSYPYSSSYPYNSGSSLVQAQAEADSGLHQPAFKPSPILNPYNQGTDSVQVQADSGFYQPESIFNPYGQGLSSARKQAQAEKGKNQPGSNSLPNLSLYNQGLSFPQMQSQVDSESYQTIIEPISMFPKPVPRLNSISESLSVPSSSYPYNPGSNSGSDQTQVQANIEPYQPIPIPNPNFSAYERFLVPYQGSSSTQTQGDNEAYEPVPIIESKENRHKSYPRLYTQGPSLALGLVSSHPYGLKLDSAQTQTENEPYQAIPIPDPNPAPYDSFLVPYKDPSFPQAQPKNEEYQTIPMPKSSPKQQEDVSRLLSEKSYLTAGFSSMNSNGLRQDSTKSQSSVERGSYQAVSILNSSSYNPYKYSGSRSQKQTDNEIYQSIPKLRLKTYLTQDETEPYQSIPIQNPDLSPYESSKVLLRELNVKVKVPSEKVKAQDERDAYQPVQIQYDPKYHTPFSSYAYNVTRSREYHPEIDDIDLSPDFKSKSGWDPFEYNPDPPSIPNPQLYPSGAEAAKAHPDFKPAASSIVDTYSQGISPYANDYPSESSYRPGAFDQAENEAQGLLNIFASGQISPVVFEHAKSRKILPHEYVFPNKMPGGENAIQCTKENEFHHFWSQGLDCLVCICLNEYGLLTPVCASCGGCHNPPPKLPKPFPRLPESIPVQPATPERFESIPIIPEPYPPVLHPEPNPVEPIEEPYQPPPTPEPYPVYPEPPSPVPVPFPEPVATLPPPPAQASCNPLPSGQPFTNPLHPCQICICRESYVTGKTDVQIDCKENPQCIAPADVTTLPPLPDVSVPIPLPICEKFPENVLFPHPTETCKLCKCAKSLSEDGVPEQQITCYPHPDCVPKVEPITEPAPHLPLPVDPYQAKSYPEAEPMPIEPLKEPFQPMEPVPLPEIVTVEPLPWPPITTIAPVPALPVLTPRPGPLPGPSPHESCRPYPPNQTFQHPWDECQICLCTEAIAVGMITVEVNCYTKPSCCIDPPDSVKAAIPGKLLLFIGYNKPISGLRNINGPDSLSLISGPTPGVITSTYRPPVHPSYSPRSVNIYPGSNQASGEDALNQPQIYPIKPYPPIKTDNGYMDPSSSYPYQPNYPTPYVNPQYPEYPPRLPVPVNTIGPYKPNNFGYRADYQYAQGDAIENYPGPHGHFHPYDPRFQAVQTPNGYPTIYQRSNYEMPPIYPPGQVRDGYAKPQVSTQSGSNAQNLAQSYTGTIGRSKSGRDGTEDSDDSQ